MSVLDPSSLLQMTAPELLAPPDPPPTPAIDTSTASTADSTSSGSSSDSGSASLGLTLTPEETAEAALVGANSTTATTVNPYETAAEEAAAALVDIGGASATTVADYEESVPPNMAAASALLSELTQSSNGNIGLLSAAYSALSSDDTLSLTAA
jgi:hypothetical protein